jgi:hypothetical protein
MRYAPLRTIALAGGCEENSQQVASQQPGLQLLSVCDWFESAATHGSAAVCAPPAGTVNRRGAVNAPPVTVTSTGVPLGFPTAMAKEKGLSVGRFELVVETAQNSVPR